MRARIPEHAGIGIREALRLKAAGISDRQIAASVGSARSTVQECLRRAREAGLTWPLPEEPDNHALEAAYALSVASGSDVGARRFHVHPWPNVQPRKRTRYRRLRWRRTALTQPAMEMLKF